MGRCPVPDCTGEKGPSGLGIHPRLEHADADYRIRVYPVSAFGVRGTPLEIVEHTWPGYPFKDGRSLCPQE